MTNPPLSLYPFSRPRDEGLELWFWHDAGHNPRRLPLARVQWARGQGDEGTILSLRPAVRWQASKQKIGN